MLRELELNRRRLALGVAPAATFEKARGPEPPAPISAVAPDNDADSRRRKHGPKSIRGINPLTGITILFILVILLAGGFIYLARTASGEFARNSRLNDEQNRLLARLEEQAARTDRQIGELDRSNRAINAGLSLTTDLWNAYGNGVCMISGTYVLVDSASGRPLRLPRDTSGSEFRSEEQIWLTPDGDGEIAKIDYEGTGFYVGDGYILSNRHVVAEPWSNDKWLQLLSDIVKGRPKLVRLQAFFPGQSRPYPLKFRLASSREDVAVCTLNPGEMQKEIPVLPLDQGSEAAMVGQAVTMMGYPSGVDRLVAFLTEKEALRLRERYGKSGAALVGQLAQRSLIKPLTSQGHIMGLHSDQIIYDAATAEGESGAPVFGPSGRVIGIHFGYFKQRDMVSSSAIPIERGLELLQRAGWRPAE